MVNKKNSKGLSFLLYQPLIKWHYLIFFIPAEIIPCGKLLWPLHYEVDEVSTAAKAAGDQEVCQDSQEPPQVNVFILLVLLFIYDGLLFCHTSAGQRTSQVFDCSNNELVLQIQYTCANCWCNIITVTMLTLKLVVIEAYLLSAVSGLPIK